jgi:hypothetical protein
MVAAELERGAAEGAAEGRADPKCALRGERKRFEPFEPERPWLVAQGITKVIAKRIAKTDDLAGEHAQEDLFGLLREA